MQVADGVNVMAMGSFASIRTPLAICGGNCAIQAFDAHGRDVFWTVTGDNVTAMCLTDYDGDGRNEVRRHVVVVSAAEWHARGGMFEPHGS